MAERDTSKVSDIVNTQSALNRLNLIKLTAKQSRLLIGEFLPPAKIIIRLMSHLCLPFA